MKKLFDMIGIDSFSSNLPKIKIGICARDKKAKAAQMASILDRLKAYGE